MADENDATGALEEFFDPSFLTELEELASGEGPAGPGPGHDLRAELEEFLRPVTAATPPLTEDAFVELPAAVVAERTNALLEILRRGKSLPAVQAAESFVVFFQALVPTIPDGASEVRRLFFRLVPTLIHIAFNDFSDTDAKREEGRAALRGLENVLIEIASVRLAPGESELVFRSIDQMAAFIGAGEYTMAGQVISGQLLGIIARNKLTRALYRIMEVEVNVQRYLGEKLGYSTPQIRVPADFGLLADYGAVRVLTEEVLGERTRYIQVQIPDIPILRDIVLRLARADGLTRDLRLDALGSAKLDVPDGTYSLGLVYQPL